MTRAHALQQVAHVVEAEGGPARGPGVQDVRLAGPEEEAPGVVLGLGRIVALYHRPSALHQIH